MLYVRGQAADYDGWAQRGNAGWSYRDVLPYFRRAENCEFAGENDEFHARGGPLNVAALRNGYDALDLLIRAAESCGYPHNRDYNGASQDGFGQYQVTQKNGLRFSAKKAYLDPARRRANLRVVTGAHVTSLKVEAGTRPRVRGLACRLRGTEIDVTANREVIVSAGAIQSPQILELSGIGNPDRLATHGIAVAHALAGVGENLTDHYISRLSWRLRSDISLNKRAHGIGLAIEVAKFLLTRRGMLTMPAGMLPDCSKPRGSRRPRHPVPYRPCKLRQPGKAAVRQLLASHSPLPAPARKSGKRSRRHQRSMKAPAIGPTIWERKIAGSMSPA